MYVCTTYARPLSVQAQYSRSCPNISSTTMQSQSHIVTDGQSISKSWCRAPSWALDQIFITLWQLRSWVVGAPPLTRGQVCLLYMLLALASVVFLGSESLGTRDHILLSQIWDFPFHRLLRLAGSRWRYSTPPPHETTPMHWRHALFITSARTGLKTPLPTVIRLGASRCLATAPVLLHIYKAVHSSGHCLFVFSRSLPLNGYIYNIIFEWYRLRMWVFSVWQIY
jgi:hypothetical protein